MLDTAPDSCQIAIITASVPQFGADMPCASHGENRALIKFTHGGYRPGAGRKPKTAPLAPTSELRWYCVRTDYGAETRADMAIRTAGFQTLYPLLWVAPVAARRTELGRAIPATSERLVPLLPTYLLVRFDRADPSWRRIPTLRGVERLFSTHPERPTAIPDRDITELTRDLAPNGCLYPAALPERAIAAKRKWVDMATALLSLQMEPA